MNRRERAVRLHDYVGAEAADVTANTVAVERIPDEVEIPEHLKVNVNAAAASRNCVRIGRRCEIVVNLETASDPSSVHVKQLSTKPPVKSCFRNDVGMKIRYGGIDGGT